MKPRNLPVLILLSCLAILMLAVPAFAAGTTQLHIVKYANDGTTILDETTKTYEELGAELTVYGDGVTHYYAQGPVFKDDPDEETEQALRWNPEENANVQEKDQGAVKGTNLKDICDLVGGMNAGETVKLKASDGLTRSFAYENVYEYTARQGPMVITWYKDGNYPDGSYSDGMKLVFFADTSVNPWGINAFGNYDWHESAAEEYWYYNWQGSEKYPTTTGLSVKYISEVLIYSDDPVPVAPVAGFTSDKQSGIAPLTVQFTDTSTNAPTSWKWDFNNDGTVDSTVQNPGHTYDTAGTYTVKLTATNAVGSDDEIKTGYITVTAAPVAPVAGFTSDKQSGTAPLTVQFTDRSTNAPTSWKWDFNNDGTVDSTAQNPSYIYATAGTYTVKLTATNTVGSDDEVKTGYITVSEAPVMVVLFDGTVTLTPGSTFTQTAYTTVGSSYIVGEDTPLGALHATGLTYDVSDKKYATDGYLLLDNIGTYLYQKTPKKAWYAYVNDVYKDGYANKADGLNLIKLADGDKVEFYFLDGTVSNPADIAAVQATATAAVKTVADIVAPVAPVAGFTSDKQSGTAPLTVQFTDTSTNAPTSWEWDFNNDGTVDSTAQNPSNIYATAGTYTVKLTATNAVGSDDEVKTGYITVTAAPVAPVAGFTSDKQSGTAPLTVQFTDTSTNTPTSWKWDFNNDGTVDSTVQNPGHTYDTAGTYTVKLTATNAVGSDDEIKTGYITVSEAPVMVVLFDGTVTLTPGSTFTQAAYNSGSSYTVEEDTPLGALHATGLTYDVSDKNYGTSGSLLLDNIGTYLYQKTPRKAWYAYVNDVYKDGYNNAAGGLNLIKLADGDKIEFYFVDGTVSDPTDLAAVQATATAAVKTVADTDGSVEGPDWTLAVKGAKDTTVTKTYFEQGLACSSSGHQVFWTDGDGNEWGGVPLWLLVAMVDDDPDVGSDHFNFNDNIAAQGYSVKVISGDGWDTTLASADIARNDNYIVANTLNGEPLPASLTSGKRSWPLHLKGSAVFGGQQVGNITSIELTGLPEPSEGWTLTLEGDVTDVITQSYFEEAIACQHEATWTDGNGDVWEGVPLWDLAGVVDDIETSSHFTFNDTRATEGYTIRVSASDGYSATFASTDAAHNNGYFLAHKLNGAALTGDDAPLKLVGSSTTSGNQRVGNVVKISLEGLPSYPAGDWQLKLVGKISDTISQPEFEEWASHHSATTTDGDGNVYKGIPLWRLLGWVDDRIPHGSNGYNDAAATAGYTVIVKAGDGYAKEFSSTAIGKNENFIVASVLNDAPLPTEGDHPPYPLRLVGSSATGGNSVGNIVEIELTDFQTPVEAPKLHIVKYDTDGTTVLSETTIDYHYMEENFEVIGDGVTVYKYQGLTLDPNDLWDSTETKGMNPPKISNAIKGTRIRDLVDLVGGMGTGTEILFIASDGYETKLGYNNIYTNPYVQSQQGDAVLAWYADGQYVPQYSAGMRLFFTPDDHVFGQWNMHEALEEKYWHYNTQDGIQYPSAAGTSNQKIVEIRVYSSPETDWELELDGTDIGGVKSTISKSYLEQALACQFGSEHKAQYTDSKGRVWEGMPLWFFAGYVDDGDQHSDAAFNDALATNGYRVIVTGSDGFSTVIDSRLIVRTSNYIVANSLNGAHIDESDENWPLRLSGANVTGTAIVKKVASIHLMRYGESPTAAFTAASEYLTVQFTDQSNGNPTGWLWDFGDGSTSTDTSPSHTYAAAGTYPVKLTVTNGAGSDVETKDVTVTAAPVAPVAAFSSVADYLTVKFTDTSTGMPTAWSWDFGDGGTSTETSPPHTYAAAGTYTVKLTVTNDVGFDDEIQDVTVGSSPAPVTAAFTADITSGKSPLVVSFTDQSTGNPTEWYWDFGDGKTSRDQNPVHTYTGRKMQSYTVTLTVLGSGGKDTETKTKYITVNPAADRPGAEFTADVTSGKSPLKVTFTDQSTGSPTAWYWSFGDGTFSKDQNPVHTYATLKKEQTYKVTLTVASANGKDTETKAKYITVTKSSGDKPEAAFTADVTSGASPLKVTFTDQSTGSPTVWYWSFGDGTFSKDQNPVHTYTTLKKEQTYTVSLTVVNTNGKDTETKAKYIMVTAADKPDAEFAADVTTGTSPLKVTFTDQSTGSPTAWYWSFGDGTFSKDQNPVHTYTTLKKEQTYAVSLTIVGADGKDTETKTKYIMVTGAERPKAAFTANVTSGKSPLAVQFTDQSTGSPTAWHWDFGDGKSSSDQNPVHTYTSRRRGESYTVKLTIITANGKDTETKTNFIKIMTK